jgi:branched-chain amino acid transport system substrate-binding protein
MKTIRLCWLTTFAFIFALAALALPAWAQTPIRIGCVFSVTGNASTLGLPEKQSIEMLVEQINARGGVLGRKLEVVMYDDKSDETEAVNMANRLISSDGVRAVIGPTTSGNSMAIIELLGSSQIPLISCGASYKIVTDVSGNARPWIFKTAPSDSLAVEKIYEYLNKNNISRVGILSVSNGYGDSGRVELERLAPNFKMELVAKEKFGQDDNDVNGQLNSIRATNPQAVVVWAVQKPAAIAAVNFRNLGLSSILVQSHGAATPKFIDLCGAAADGQLLPLGRLLVANQLPSSDPQRGVILKYKSDFEAKFGANSISTFGGHAYDALNLVVKAIEMGGSDNPATIRDNLERINGYPGVTGVFNMSSRDHNGLTKDAFVMARIQNHSFQYLDLGGSTSIATRTDPTPPPTKRPPPPPQPPTQNPAPTNLAGASSSPPPGTSLVNFTSTPKDFQAYYFKGSKCDSIGCARYNAQGYCEQYEGNVENPGQGLSVDLNQDGTPVYVFTCFQPAHGPAETDVFAKIGGKWKNIGPGFSCCSEPDDLKALLVLEQTDCGYHRFKFSWGGETNTYQFDGEKYDNVSNSPKLKCKSQPPPPPPPPAPTTKPTPPPQPTNPPPAVTVSKPGPAPEPPASTAKGSDLPCQKDLEYYGLLPGTVKVFSGQGGYYSPDGAGGITDEGTFSVTRTEKVQKVSQDGEACKIEIAIEENRSGKTGDFPPHETNTKFMYIYQGKLYGNVYVPVSVKRGDPPNYSRFGGPGEWSAPFWSKNLVVGSHWGAGSNQVSGTQCDFIGKEDVSSSAGKYSGCARADCFDDADGSYSIWFDEQVGVVKFKVAGEVGGEEFLLQSLSKSNPTGPVQPPPVPPAQPSNSGGSKGGTTSPSSTVTQPPIRLKGKEFSMCSDEATIKALYPAVAESDGASGDGKKLELALSGMDIAKFYFDHDCLVRVDLDSDSTEGPRDEIKGFGDWLQSKHGKGKDIKQKDPETYHREWTIGKVKISQNGWYNDTSGDGGWGYVLECPASACATAAITPPPPQPPPVTPPTTPAPTPGPVFVPISLIDAGVINDLAADLDVKGKLYAATSGQGILVSLDGGKTWQKCGWSYGPAIRVIAVSGEVLALSSNNGLYKSSDGGGSWNGVKPAEGGLTFTCVTWPTNSIIYLGTNRGVFSSDNAGKTWKLVGTGQPVRWVDAREDKPERVIVLFETGELALSKDSGQTWNSLTRDPANLRFYRTLGASPLFFLIRADGKLMCSTDFGANWVLVSGFTGEPRCIKCLSGCQCLGLLTATGLYQSCDNGKSWELIRSTEGKDLTSLLVTDRGEIVIGGPGVIRKPATIVDQRLLGDVNFKTGSADLTPAAQAELDGIAATLQQKPGLRVRVEGHTDNVGGDDYNLDLSRRRAESVKTYLVSKGLSADRFEVQGYGKAYPIADNNTDEGRAKNRRVVVYLLD